MARNNWAREEHIVAFNLYCKVPFTKINSSNKEVQKLAVLIGRTPGSVAMKLANFARLDPILQARNISGLSQGAKGEEDIWNEFNSNWEKLTFESERILASYKSNSIGTSLNVNILDIPPEGKNRKSMVKTRINQNFFRKAILASYDNKCCITGINIPELLVASHIIPWSKDITNRTNPANGLCLNALHDKAFDIGLMTITTDYVIQFSEILINNFSNQEPEKFLLKYNNRKIQLPQRFYPKKEFLEYHNMNIFQK